MAKPSEQLLAYFQRKAEKLEELADHHASIGEPVQAKDLYTQAKAMFERITGKEDITRIDEKLQKLKG